MQYFSEIRGIKETDKGTDLLLHIPGEMVQGRIIKYRNNNKINSEIRIDDGRSITPDQRKKIFATIKDISLYTGDHPEDLRAFLLYDYCIENGIVPFSLRDCSIGQAREYITFIIDFILKHNIPLSDLAINRTDDIDKYLYGCLKYRRCCITGKASADIHHVEGSRVGMGRDRTKINHRGLELMALCREWHTKVHQQGEEEIFKNYKIYGISIDEKTMDLLGLSYDDIN